MTGGWLLARNDFRALLPLWGAVALVVAAGSRVGGGMWREIAFLTYGAGSVAVVAHAFGHEYAHRTLPALLAQPLDRRRLFLTKLGVAAILLLALAAVAYTTLFAGDRPDWLGTSLPAVPLLVIFGALFVAPLVTMVCRNSLAGALFAASVPGVVATGALLVGIVRFGLADTAAVDAFQERWFWRLMPIVIAIAGFASWRMFLNLEAIDGRHRHINLPAWLFRQRRASATHRAPRSPVWQLVRKELHLQQLSFVVAAFHLVTTGGVLLWLRVNPTLSPDVFAALTGMYAAGQAMLIGSLASAEERHLGTIEWQILLPVSSGRQWAVKTAVVMALTLALPVALPAAYLHAVQGIAFRFHQLFPLLIVLMLAVTSLYASSLSTSGVRAFILSVPLVLVGWMFFWLGGILGGLVVRAIAAHPGRIVASPTGEQAAMVTLWAAAAVLGALMLQYGYRNHRSADARFASAARQIPWLAAIVAAGTALVVVVW